MPESVGNFGQETLTPAMRERNGVLLHVLEAVGFRDEKEERSGKRKIGARVVTSLSLTSLCTVLAMIFSDGVCAA